MKDNPGTNKGLTFVEVLVSSMLIIIFLTGAAGIILNSQLLSGLARHKLQASYAAQQILEQQRRRAFSSIVSQGAAPITLDTKGTYAATADDFTGIVIITVTNISGSQKKVQVEIDWPERLFTGDQLTLKEYYATTITNEALLN